VAVRKNLPSFYITIKIGEMQDPQKTEKQPSTRIPKTWCDFLHKESKALEIKKTPSTNI
jgi:hypothetical protein